MAELLGCSRAQAEQYIEGGWVRVAGEVVETPQALVDAAQVALDADAPPVAMVQAAEPATMLLHKPIPVPTATAARSACCNATSPTSRR